MAVYTVLEHEYVAPVGCWTEAPARVTLIPVDFFDWLYAAAEETLDHALKPAVYQRRGVLKLQQFVGLIQSPDGDQLEILPKTTRLDSETGVQAGRQLLVQMLQQVPEFPQFLPWQAHVALASWPLWSLWVGQMLAAVAQVVRHGLRSAYGEQEGQQTALRGRLLVAEQVRHNSLHRERLYCRFPVYTQDRAENRLLSRLLHELSRQPLNAGQHQQLRQLRLHFEGIPVSLDWRRDWRAVQLARGMTAYRAALDWLYWLLTRQMPITTAGAASGWSLLLDMNRLFEHAVARQLRPGLPPGWQLREQGKGRYLFHQALHELVPDLLLCDAQGRVVALLDAKWKRLEHADPLQAGKLDRADLFQMKAYAMAYLPQGGPILLVYPNTAQFLAPSAWTPFAHLPQCRLRAVPLDPLAETPPHWLAEGLASTLDSAAALG